MSVHAVLTGAVDLIELKGWVQEGYQSPDGCLCTVGAIVLAAGSGFKYDEDGEPEDFIGNDDIYAALEAIETVIGSPTGEPAYTKTVVARPEWDTVSWNDEPGRTQGEVLSVLRAAAKLVAA